VPGGHAVGDRACVLDQTDGIQATVGALTDIRGRRGAWEGMELQHSTPSSTSEGLSAPTRARHCVPRCRLRHAPFVRGAYDAEPAKNSRSSTPRAKHPCSFCNVRRRDALQRTFVAEHGVHFGGNARLVAMASTTCTAVCTRRHRSGIVATCSSTSPRVMQCSPALCTAFHQLHCGFEASSDGIWPAWRP